LPASSPHHAKGLALTAVGGLTLTFDVPLIRLADGDHWSILLLRSSTTLVATLLIWLAWRGLRGNAPSLIPGKAGLIVAALYGLSSITFMTSVYHTSTANVVFILAFNSMFAALLSWLLLGERPAVSTLITMAVMAGGVFIIVSASMGSGHLFGDLMAVVTAMLIASAITISRSTGRDMGFAALVAVLIPLAVAAPMVATTGLSVAVPWWIILNGAVVMPVAFFCLATGPKYLSGPEVAMFYLLETVLAPIWVWMIFAEVPADATLTGGAILIVALVAHSLWQLNHGRRRKAAGALRHPA
jgi:drug/metabolite transporter (DMT)-like permease